ncbi:MAG TPA: VOC family protein [Streptosporangiaceae bacterium]|nr:VOC family protein [Streptosporangiaceae bacterium]
MSQEPPVGWIREVVLDAPDPWALARFWSGLLGGTPVEWYPGWVTLEPPPHGQRLSFQGTATPLAEDTARVHFDILVEDLAAAHDRVLSAGATLASEHVSPRPGPGGQSVPWRVYRDPAGHPFCLVVRLRPGARPGKATPVPAVTAPAGGTGRDCASEHAGGITRHTACPPGPALTAITRPAGRLPGRSAPGWPTARGG